MNEQLQEVFDERLAKMQCADTGLIYEHSAFCRGMVTALMVSLSIPADEGVQLFEQVRTTTQAALAGVEA